MDGSYKQWSRVAITICLAMICIVLIDYNMTGERFNSVQVITLITGYFFIGILWVMMVALGNPKVSGEGYFIYRVLEDTSPERQGKTIHEFLTDFRLSDERAEFKDIAFGKHHIFEREMIVFKTYRHAKCILSLIPEKYKYGIHGMSIGYKKWDGKKYHAVYKNQ